MWLTICILWPCDLLQTLNRLGDRERPFSGWPWMCLVQIEWLFVTLTSELRDPGWKILKGTDWRRIVDVEYESYRVLIFARNSNRQIRFVFKLRSFGLILGCILPHLQKLMVLRDFRLFKNNSERLKNAKEKTQKKKSHSVTSEKNENSNLHTYLPIILGLSTTIFGFSLFGSSLAGFSIFGSAFWGGGTVFGTAYFADSVFGNAYFGRSLFGSREGIFWETVYFSYSKMIVRVRSGTCPSLIPQKAYSQA